MIQFKEKGGRPRTRASLFTYPCLMAADILLYDADGCRWAATRASTSSWRATSRSRFNREYGETFVVPESGAGGARRACRPTSPTRPRR